MVCYLSLVIITSIALGLSHFKVKKINEKNTKNIEEIDKKKLEDVYDQLEFNFKLLSNSAKLGAFFIAKNKKTIEIISKAYTLHKEIIDEDQNEINIKNNYKKLERLRKEMRRLYEHLALKNNHFSKENPLHDIVQSHFHILNPEEIKLPLSFYRLHQPEKYYFDPKKDYLYFRKMIIDVHEKNRENPETEFSKSGVEIGIAGFGIRSVVPIIDEGKLVGSFEFGFDHTSLIEKIAEKTNTSIAILLDKEIFETADDTSSKKTPKTQKIPLNKELLNKLFTEDPALIRSDINGNGTLCSDRCATLTRSTILNNKQWFKNKKNNEEGKYFSIKDDNIYTHALKDINGQAIGFVFIMRKNTTI